MQNQRYTEGAASSSAIDGEVKNANRERREVALTDEQLASLGHRKRNPIKVIRAFCLSCMGDNSAEVRRCTSPGCALFPYRMGRNPYTDRKGGAGFAVPTARSPIQDERGESPANPGNGSKEGTAEL
jgi:hypothetical protein